MDKYQHGKVAVNAVIFTIKEQKLKVYLDRREKDPYVGKKELPGGLLLEKETAEDTLKRKLKDIVGHDKVFFEQFYTFTQPNRDPRGRIISIGFIALVASEKISADQNFYDAESLSDLAFDHMDIIIKAYQYLQQNLDHKFAKQFLPEIFPLNDLQTVYEVVGEKKFDNRNFRKKMLSSGIVKQVKQIQKNVPHRPASLYKFTK